MGEGKVLERGEFARGLKKLRDWRAVGLQFKNAATEAVGKDFEGRARAGEGSV